MQQFARACAQSFVAGLCAVLATGASLTAQSPPAAGRFEVASIRRSDATEARSGFAIRPGGRFVATNVTARELVAAAHRVDRGRVEGGPAWIDSDRFTVEAIAFENVTRELLEPLLRNLLAERFKLRQRVEKRDLPVLAL